MRKIEQVYLDGLQIPEHRYRGVNQKKVAALAASMAAIGLQQPITVWENPAEKGSDVRIVAGVHRVLAARELGWEQIDAICIELDEIDRKRWEIAENLHRAELTALEHDQHLAEWVTLTEQAEAEKNSPPVMELTRERDPEPVKRRGRPKKSLKPLQSGAVSGKGGRGKKSGVNQASRELGVTQQDARRALKVASLTEEAKKAAIEVGLDDNRSALLEAAAQPAPQQAATIRGIAEAKAEAKRHPKIAEAPLSIPLQKLIDAASDFSGDDPDHQFNLLICAWEASDDETRRRFMKWVPSTYLNSIAA